MQIYLVTNMVNGKKYVGKTVYEIKYRKRKHIGELTTSSKKHYPLYSAIKKYGKDNFKWEVIDTATSENQLNEKEKHWIKEHNTISPNGYNLTCGGDGQTGFKHTDETKRKISDNNFWKGTSGIMYGKKHTEESIKKMSEAKKGKPTKIVYDERIRDVLREQKLGEKNPMYGRPSQFAKKVINIDTLDVYENLHEAGRLTNIAWQNIGRVCRKQGKTAGNFRWMYFDEYKSIPSQAEKSEGVTTSQKT